jgi:hypothetical protein
MVVVAAFATSAAGVLPDAAIMLTYGEPDLT